MAGVTKESVERMGVTTITNMLDVLDGKPNLENVINREIYQHR
jgi:phosphoglycerate dehydrogenase-like enzyme